MPAIHEIDNENQIIVTTWSGDDPDDTSLLNAYIEYLKEIKTRPEYISYDELLDFSNINTAKLTASGLREVGRLAAVSDDSDISIRFAIVVNSTLSYGLARMYEMYRELNPLSNKKLRVFRDSVGALDWLKSER